jgi:hypothetical protein
VLGNVDSKKENTEILAHVQKQNHVRMFTTQKQLKYQVVVLPCLDKMMNQKQ